MTPSDGPVTLTRGLGDARPETDLRHRVEVIEQLLTSYHQLVDPLQQGSGNGPTGVLLMPATYTPSVRELERILKAMRDDPRNAILRHEDGTKRILDGKPVTPRRLWWHANAWYIQCERVTVRPTLKASRNAKGKLSRLRVDEHGQPLAVDTTGRPLVRVLRAPEARYQLAQAALQHIAENWALPHEPMLPTELATAA